MAQLRTEIKLVPGCPQAGAAFAFCSGLGACSEPLALLELGAAWLWAVHHCLGHWSLSASPSTPSPVCLIPGDNLLAFKVDPQL